MLAAAILALTARAAVVVDAPVEELVARSDAVVHGLVLSTQAEKSADGSRIFTRVTVRVLEAIKGRPGETVVLTVPGGEIGEVAMSVPGAPTFAVGEEVVLLLHRRPGTKVYGVQALGRGKYKVEKTDRGKVAAPQTEQVELVRRGPDGRMVPAPPAGPEPLPALLDRLRGAARQGKPR